MQHTRRTILHLCADTGSDTWAYRQDWIDYEVVTIGSDIGVENYSPPEGLTVWGVFANPVCTDLTPAKHGKQYGGGERPERDLEKAMWLVRECQRVIAEAVPRWWAIENPASGLLRNYLGDPTFTYEPWQFGSPWTKRTALWGSFTPPTPVYRHWDDVPKLPGLYARPGRRPSLAFMHKSAWDLIPEFRDSGMPRPQSDMEFRSLCSQRFAAAFKAVNP